jgi:transcriptional regulator with XRE-family HTH domain
MSIEKGQKPSIVESEIGKRIKAFRTKKSVTLERLQSQIGFTKGDLPKVEKSKKSPPVSAVGINARAFGVTISAIPGEENHSVLSCFVKKWGRPFISKESNSSEYSYEGIA